MISLCEKIGDNFVVSGNNPFHGHKPVFIECGSANSFELSPRFANMSIRYHFHFMIMEIILPVFRGSREAVHLDVENELREAMSDTVQKQSGEGELRKD